MRRFSIVIATAAVAGSIVAGACGSSSTSVKTPAADVMTPMAAADVIVDETVTIDAKNVKFVPNNVTVTAGKTVRLILVNQDKGTEHDLASDDLMISMMSGGGHGGGHDSGAASGMKLAVHTKEGETSSVVFIAETPGTYAVYCTVPGHKAAGMVGTITVT